MAPSDISPLVRLPRELRDRIYTHALYESEGLFFHREDDYKAYFCTTWRQPLKTNQLKYTCRQVRSETLGFEWQINDFIFLSHGSRCGRFVEKSPPAQLIGFLDMCSELWRQHIRCVVLLTHDDPQVNNSATNLPHLYDLDLVARTCENYPLMTVRWHLDLGYESLNDIVLDGLVVVLGLRSNAADVHDLLKDLGMNPVHVNWGTYTKSWCRTWKCSRGWSTHENVLPMQNFRIIPYGERIGAEELRMKMNWHTAADEPTYHDAPGVRGAQFFEKRLALAMEWARNGF